MKRARSLLIFSYGLFTIAAQALLFREFITTFEGNDISVGIFFASWFLWVGLGAIVVYRAQIIAEKLLKNIELLFLSYLPAFILQLILIIQARELVGIESYALWSVWAILIVSIIVNAPVSIITGMLFPVACRWIEKDQKLPVSQVYIIEAAGSFVGGLGVTALLALGISSARIFFILAIR
jgi:spermidine synthase